jgi:hypothetical protein
LLFFFGEYAYVHRAYLGAGVTFRAELRVDNVGTAFTDCPFGTLRKADPAFYAFIENFVRHGLRGFTRLGFGATRR